MRSTSSGVIAIVAAIFALLLSVTAMVLRYSRGKELDYFHLIFTACLVLFIIVLVRKRDNS